MNAYVHVRVFILIFKNKFAIYASSSDKLKVFVHKATVSRDRKYRATKTDTLMRHWK